MREQKRFIAGAICPRCAEMDKVRTWEQNGIRYRDCVVCDFFEQLPIEEPGTGDEIETRVTHRHETPQESDFQPVRILDPKG